MKPSPESLGGVAKGGEGWGCDPVSRTNFNKIHAPHILSAAFNNGVLFHKFTNHVRLLVVFHASHTNFCPHHESRINLCHPREGFPYDRSDRYHRRDRTETYQNLSVWNYQPKLKYITDCFSSRSMPVTSNKIS